MATVGEGIETIRQLRQLQALGCTYGQGYLLARPADPEVIANLLAGGSRWPWSPFIAGPTAEHGTLDRLPRPMGENPLPSRLASDV